MGEWIKCSERMPEATGENDDASDNVLIYAPDCDEDWIGWFATRSAFYSHGLGLWVLQNGDNLHDEDVTHWQPLPEPPHD